MFITIKKKNENKIKSKRKEIIRVINIIVVFELK
jgi:hypothetical protein